MKIALYSLGTPEYTIEETAKSLNTNLMGLTDAEAEENIKKYGKNIS